MKRILFILGCVVMSCGPSDGGPSDTKAQEGRRQVQALEAPSDTVLPTEVGADGFVAGRSTGMSSVTPDGAASYALPLWLPAGRAGVQPGLALTYRSDLGNGLLGVGWSLAGLSQISRCGRTQAQDGRVEPITFTAADAFCLDGQRLVAVQGVYGASGTEYRTEQEGFSKIVSLDADASGPQRFRVFLKSGHILTYGLLHDSTLVGERISVRPVDDAGFSTTRDGRENRLAWALAKLEDRSGNSVTYHYTVHRDAADTSHELTLDRIEYTASSVGSGLPATRFVDFEYEARPDTRVSYVSGFKLKSSRRLKELRVRAPNPVAVGPVRAYRFTYVTDALSRLSLLDSFQECDGAGACMRPITFGWTLGSAAFQEVDTQVTDLTQGPAASFWILNPVDVDGDGRDEVFYRKPYDSTRYKWAFRSLGPSGVMTGADEGGGLPLLCWDVGRGHDGRWVDVNRDGRIDVSLLEWTACTSSPSNRLKHFQRTNHPPPGYNWFSPVEDDGPSGSDFWYTDLNADSLPDLVRMALVGGRLQLGYRLNVAGSLQPFQSIHTSDRNDNNQLVADLEGTGRTSLLIVEKRSAPDGGYEAVGQRYWALTWRDGAFEKQETTLVRTDVSEQQYLFADLNGDGLADALRAGRQGGDLEVLLNTGNGFAAPYTVDLGPGAELGSFTRDNGIRVLDFNEDGLQDLLLMDDGGGTRTSPVVLESDGSGFQVRPLSMSLGQTAGTRGYKLSQVLDANGDGLADLAQVVQGTLRLYLRQGQPSGLLASVTDSLGARVEFTYKPMSDPSVYTPGTTCTHPQACLRKGRWLVSEHRADAGDSHPMRVRQYTYEDGRMDALGRGWLGFGAVTVREVAAGTELRTEFDHQTRVGTHYPYAKRPRREVAHVTGEGRLRLTTRTTEYAHSLRSPAGGGSILTVLPDHATEEVYDRLETEPATAGLLRRAETDWEYDWTYGNLTSRRETVGTDVLAWTAEYQNDALAWLVGLTRREQETSTVNGVSVTRTRAYEWQPGTSLLARETVEPGDAALEVVTAYQRNADGLASQMTRTAAGLPARTTHIRYDTVDRTYPAGMTNGLGHSTQVAYHGGLGVIAVSVDENGLSTQSRYDGFGRPRGVDAPGASDSTLSYTACAAGSGCAFMVKNQQRTSAAVDGVKEVLTTHDRLGRTLSTRTLAFGGEPAATSNEYDGLGRMVKQWLPSPTGGPPAATSFAYDGLGRPLRATYPDGTRRRWQYEGSRVSAWDEKDNVTVTSLDAYGRVLTTEDLLGPQRVVTRYAYGPFGLLESVTNGYGQGPRYTYDRLGRRTRLEDPDSGVRVTRYNSFGEPTEETDGNGDTTAYTRDVLGRVLTRTSRLGVTRFTWDQPDPSNPSLGRVGQLLSSVQEGDPGTSLDDIAVVLGYDALGRPVSEAWSVEGEAYSLSWTYDDYGLLRRLDYPGVGGSRFAVAYDYKPWGALEAVRDASGPTVYWRAEARNGLDQLTSEVFGNGVVSQRRYDKRGRLLFIDTKAGAQPLQALAYEYEANSNLRSRHDRVGRTTEDFTYDALDRLTRWTAYQNCGATVVDYGHDDLGNLLSRTVSQGTGQSLSYFYEGTGGAGPHAVSRSSLGAYTYDGNGNQLTAPGRAVEYTPFNLPSRVTQGGQSVTFRYDALNRRTVKRSSSGDVTVSLGGLYEVRRTAAGTAVHAFNVVGADRTVAQVSWATDAAGAVGARKALYLHADHLGSVETVTDEAGGVIERMRYEPFGGRRFAHALDSARARASARVRQGFTGHEHDEELGLINMKGRMYDATLGRFLSPDPLMVGPRPSQALNRYSYALNNPLRYTDPTGFATNELPVIIYDSWYGGYTYAGSSAQFAPPTIRDCNADESICWTGEPDTNSPNTEIPGTEMSPEFSYFLNRLLLSSWLPGPVREFGRGLLLGGLAGAVPFLGLVPPPEGQSKHFYVGYAGALFAWGGVELVVGVAGGLAGGTAAVGGAAVSLSGVGALVGVPAAALGISAAMAAAGVATAGAANWVGAYNAVQMANQAGNGGGATSTSGSGGPEKRGPKTDPNAPHNAKVREVAAQVEDGEVIAGGGTKPERLIPTPDGLKSGRRPDILVQKPDGSQYGINVGREAASGAPVRREVEAINDLEGAGLPMHFVPYQP